MEPLLSKKVISFFLFLMISISICAQRPAETIPEFKFFKLNRSSFTNKNLEANKLLFFCFFDISCDHCQHAIEKISQHYSGFNGTAIYLITLDNLNAIEKFMNKYGQNLLGKKNVTILQDLQYEFINKFKPKKYPSIFLYSHNRRLILYDDNPENMFMFLKQIKLLAK